MPNFEDEVTAVATVNKILENMTLIAGNELVSTLAGTTFQLGSGSEKHGD